MADFFFKAPEYITITLSQINVEIKKHESPTDNKKNSTIINKTTKS